MTFLRCLWRRITFKFKYFCLTRIVAINWPHGGELSLQQLNAINGRLEVHFDRELQAGGHEATGINSYTFLVQYGRGTDMNLEFMEGEVKLEQNGCVAVFLIDPEHLQGRRRIESVDVFITLKCDFIPDRRGIPVDGNFLCGRTPSGNGTPGGDFESWLHIPSQQE